MAEAQTQPQEQTPEIPAEMTGEEAVALLGEWDAAPPDQSSEEGKPHPSVENLPPSPLSDEGREEAKATEEQTQNEEAVEELPPEETTEEAQEASEEDTASDQKEPPSSETEETVEADPGDDLPPIDPPSTLNRKQRDTFRSLPREVQERWAEIEETESREVRRLQTAIDEQKRTLEAETRAAQEAKAQYEAALPNVQSMVNNELATKFPDVRTWDDVQRMRAQNPNRYLEWDALTKQAQAVNADLQAAEQQRQQELASQYSRYVQEQDIKFRTEHPEWADPEVGPQLQKQAVELMEDIGFSRDEIISFYQQGQPLSAVDARFQALIAELVSLRAKNRKAEAALKSKTKQKLPPVTKPGVPKTKQEIADSDLDNLRKRAAESGRVEDAVALLAAQGGG